MKDEHDQNDIFISYARPDKQTAEELAKVFEQQGWSVWWDRDLLPGDEFDKIIAAELGSARAVVVLWSQTSVARGWVKDEAQEGADRGVLIPVLIDGAKIPMGFRQIQTANLSGWHGSPSDVELNSLLRKIGALIRRPVTVIKPTPAERAKYFFRRWRTAALLSALAAALAVAGALLYASRREAPQPPAQNNNNNGGGAATRINTQSEDEARHASLKRALELTSDGLKQAGESNYEGAIDYYQQAIKANADYPNVYYHRAQSYVVLQRNDLAVADFRKFLSLSDDAARRQEAERLVGKLVNPGGGTQTTGVSNANANTANANTGTNNSGMRLPSPTPVSTTEVLAPLVDQMFAEDRETRIAATTKLIAEYKRDPAVVPLALTKALSLSTHRPGVINVLVLLKSVPPATLRRHRADIERLFELAKNNGPQTTQHIKNLSDILGGGSE